MYTPALSLVPTRLLSHLCPPTALAEVIARGLGASAKLSAAAQQLFEKLAKRVKKKKHEYKNDDLVSIAWAFGQLKLESPKLFDILGYRTIQTENLPPDQVSKLLWAFGRLSHMAPVIFQALGSRLKATLDEYSASQAASAAWSYAACSHWNPGLFDTFSGKLGPKLGSFSAADLGNLGWSYAVFDDFNTGKKLFGESGWTNRLASVGISGLGDGPLAQLHQWELWREERGSIWPRYLISPPRHPFLPYVRTPPFPHASDSDS